MLATLLTLIVVATGGDDDGDTGVTAGTSTTSAVPTSTTSTSTSTTAPPPETTTTAPPAPTTTGAPATTAAPLPVVTGQGAVLRPPASPETRVTSPGGGCEQLGDDGWTVTCGTAGSKDGVLAWLIETRSIAGETARRALVLRRTTAQQWTVVLRANDDSGSQFTGIKARVEDVSGDGASEIAFGFTRTGASAVLAVDVVEGPGVVVVHRELPRGSARVSSGQLDTWRRADSTRFVHEVIQFRDGAWHIVGSAAVPPSDVPPSQL